MKCQSLSGENEKNSITLSSAEVVGQTGLSKQRKTRSDAPERGV